MAKYKIQKHKQLTDLNNKDVYIIWKETKSEHGYGTKGIYQGTKDECKKKLEQIRGGGKDEKNN